MKWLDYDCETGGKTPGVNQVVSIGIAIREDDEILAKHEWIVGPKRHYKTGVIERVYDVVALQISGISWKQIQEAPKPELIVKELNEFANDNGCRHMPIVAFNASFDHGFYSDLLFMAGNYDPSKQSFQTAFPPFLGGWHCAMLAAKEAFPHLPNYKLDTVAEHLKLSRSSEKHGALEDAVLGGNIWLAAKNIKAVAA